MSAIFSLIYFFVCVLCVRAAGSSSANFLASFDDKIVTGAGIDSPLWRWSSDDGKCRFVRGPRA
jgi:hypothetical protein